MATFIPFQTQLVSIMDTLAKAAVFEICKLVDIESRGLKQEISRSQREIISLKNKLHMMQNLIWSAGEHDRNTIRGDRLTTPPERAPEDPTPSQSITVPDVPRIKSEPPDENPVSVSDDCQVANEQFTDAHQIITTKEEELEIKLCNNSNPSEMLNSCEEGMGLARGSHKHVMTLLTDNQDGVGACDSTPTELITRTQVSPASELSRILQPASELSQILRPGTQNGETSTQPHPKPPKRPAPLLVHPSTRTFVSLPTSQRHSLTRAQRTVDQGPGRGDRSFVCNYCSKRFRCISQLETHERSHTGEKPFHCLLCGKRYAQKGHLYIHQRTHTGEKPYRCLTCGKGFIQKCTLDMHQRTHTGEKPFCCTRCGKGFTKKCNLKKHQTSHMEFGGDMCGPC